VTRFRGRIWTRGGCVSSRFPAGRPAGGVEVAQYLDIGGQQAGLGVGDAALGAERPHRGLGVTQARPRLQRRSRLVGTLVPSCSSGGQCVPRGTMPDGTDCNPECHPQLWWLPLR